MRDLNALDGLVCRRGYASSGANVDARSTSTPTSKSRKKYGTILRRRLILLDCCKDATAAYADRVLD